MPHGPAIAYPAYEKPWPLEVELFGAEAIVHTPNALAQLVKQAGRQQCSSAGLPDFTGFLELDMHPVYLAESKAESHFQEGHMTNLWSSAQLVEQVLLLVLDTAQRQR